MTLVGLTVASLLALAPPETEEGFVVTPATTGAPAPAPAPAPPPPAPDWGPSTVVVVSQPAPAPRPVPPPPAPRKIPHRPAAGIGLMVSSSVLFTVGLGLRLSAFDRAVAHCNDHGRSDFPNQGACFESHDSRKIGNNDLQVGLLYGSSMVVGMIGSGALGQRQAWQTHFGDRRYRNPNSRLVAGALMTGLGVASIGVHFGLLYADHQNPCTTWDCAVERRAMWIATSDGGAAALNIGMQLFSWGGNYKRNLRKYQTRWSLRPGVTPGSVGATVTGRF